VRTAQIRGNPLGVAHRYGCQNVFFVTRTFGHLSCADFDRLCESVSACIYW